MAKKNLPDDGITNIIEGYDSFSKNSDINGIDITIAHYLDTNKTDKYYAEFMFSGNGYKVYAKDLSIEEFTKVLVSLVNN